uniref:Uncharacterized protein n=1 Tax=Rhizophora mucronata TaxID=61149 RepID=A0A2P2Q3J6_RHIMU
MLYSSAGVPFEVNQQGRIATGRQKSQKEQTGLPL